MAEAWAEVSRCLQAHFIALRTALKRQIRCATRSDETGQIAREPKAFCFTGAHGVFLAVQMKDVLQMNLYLLSALGGVLIGISTVWLMATLGRIAGISGIAGNVLFGHSGERAWRVAFVMGLVVAPLLLVLTSGDSGIRAPVAPWPWMLVAGLLVGVGTRLGNGCTSGHGVCGLARLSPRSMLATGTFMICAFATTYVLRHVVGGVTW